ncbi:MAG: tryptophan-rich sensory protein [Salinimicrobium sp.]
MKKILAVGNIIAFLATVAFNYISNTGAINGNTMSTISAKYENLFTPAGYAFSIWGLIYLMLFGFVVYQSFTLFGHRRPGKAVAKVGIWFIVSCIANISWIFAWLNEYIGLSVMVMLLLLFSLIIIILRGRLELDDESLPVIAFFWWPFTFYSGWITVALIANIAAFLTAEGWSGFGISEVAWTIIMIVAAGLINLVITWTRNMREFALVGAWGLAAVAVANWDKHQSIVIAGIAIAGILLLSTAIHGFKNRNTAPWTKL